jgi:chemotaxis protein CheD
MSIHCLNIGDVKTFDSPVVLTCFGLGSCIGLFVQDRTTGLSGGAHILLPTGVRDNEENGYVAKHAVDKLLIQFQHRGSGLATLRAKITGGANVLNTSINIGAQNIKSLMKELIQRNIYIAASDVGGVESRTARFESQSGKLYVKTLSNSKYRIY